MTKHCRKCGVEKDTAEFYKDSKSADRLRYECKQCNKQLAGEWQRRDGHGAQIMRNWRAADPARALEVSRRAAAKRDPERHRELRKAWYEKHREQEIAKAGEYSKRPDVRARQNARNRERYATDPLYKARVKVYANSRRRLIDKGDLTAEQWLTICATYNDRCAYCGNPATAMDHVVAISRGGQHTASNVVPSCKPCNSQKKARTPLEWLGAPTSDILLTMGTSFAPLMQAYNSPMTGAL